MKTSHLARVLAIASVVLVAACSQPEPPPAVVGVKTGKPYEVNGKTYYPAPVDDGGYEATGDASWYGPGFHGKRTASGEKFNENDLTAAHPTLPMPSLVLVTNLQNNKSVVVRINDRGPFHSGRIIDLAKGSAQAIGLKKTQPVHIKYLKKETEDYLAAFSAGEMDKLSMSEINRRYFSDSRDEVAVTSGSGVTDSFSQETENAAPVQKIEASNLSAPAKKNDKSSLSVIKQAHADTNQNTKVGGEVNIIPKGQIASSDLAPVTEKASDGVNLDSVDKSADKSQVSSSVKAKSSSLSAHYSTVQNLAVKPAIKKPQGASIETKGDDSSDLVKSDGQKQAAKKSAGKFAVLAGSFASEDNAKKLAKKLSDVGSVSIDKVSVAGKTLWRVEVVGFANRNEAEDALGEVRNRGVGDAKVISN